VLTLTLVNLEDHADVGMIQRRRRLRLALEASESLCVFGNVVRQELQRHKAVEFHILRFVNNTHPASAEFLDDEVVRDGLADHWSRIVRVRNGQVNEGGGLAWRRIVGAKSRFHSLTSG